MQELSWSTRDKSEWGPGEWQNEPDKMQWTDDDAGYPCLIVRGPLGALCGYVGVSEDHPLHGVEYSEYGKVDVGVHWGLTFSGACQETDDPAKGICHVPSEGEPESLWWFGFDCAHCDDFCPGMSPSKFGRNYNDIYRNIYFVKDECANLARQLKNLS